MTDVDQCEVNRKLAYNTNVKGVKNVLETCKKIKCKLIFLSTDFLFDGIKKRGYHYKETDTPNPLNYYAQTKYKAELNIYSSGIEYLICRSAVLYGWNDKKFNFITWILNNLKKNITISIVTSQINSPTFVVNLAQIILKLIEKNARGIYHTVGDCVLNRFEMALKCAEIFEYNKNLIIPIENFEQKAIRPKNAGLSIMKLKNLLGSTFKIFNLDEGLTYMKHHQ